MEKSLEKIKENLTKFLLVKEEIVLAYLFGSSLRGMIGGRHDIDVAILLAPKAFETLESAPNYKYETELIAGLVHLLKHNRVDLVILNRATPLLAYEVIHNGNVLFSRSEDQRIQFEVLSLKRHSDTKHLRTIKRIYIKERSKQGLPAYD
jgi:predicted nucleotidyltransferase